MLSFWTWNVCCEWPHFVLYRTVLAVRSLWRLSDFISCLDLESLDTINRHENNSSAVPCYTSEHSQPYRRTCPWSVANCSKRRSWNNSNEVFVMGVKEIGLNLTGYNWIMPVVAVVTGFHGSWKHQCSGVYCPCVIKDPAMKVQEELGLQLNEFFTSIL